MSAGNASAPPHGPRTRQTASPLRKVLLAAGGVLALVLVMDWAGWPGLAGPLSGVLGKVLQRSVEVDKGSTRFHFLGGLRMESGHLRIGASDWSGDPYFLDATGLRLRLGYGDLYRAWRGNRLHVRLLEAGKVDVHVRRLADGRGSWPLGDVERKDDSKRELPSFGTLVLKNGDVAYQDEGRRLKVAVKLGLREGRPAVGAGARQPVDGGLTAHFAGVYQDKRFAGTLRADGVMPLVAKAEKPVPLEVYLEAQNTLLHFKGAASDVLSLKAFKGRFVAGGPSLGETGTLLGVTLPTTERYRIAGQVERSSHTWQVVAEDARIGRSRLSGSFKYDTEPKIPLLSGQLHGEQLFLADLAPTVGAPSKQAPATRSGKVLPDRRFDIPSLSRMDAAVAVDIKQVELGAMFSQPIAPLRLNVSLRNGVLALTELTAATAEGTLQGQLSFDGRDQKGLWKADLAWRNVQLHKWIKQTRSPGSPPYVSGALDGNIKVNGRGRSTAAILGNLDGDIDVRLRNGQLSHLLIEAAGIDLAQALGVALRGDAPLPTGCAMARFGVKDGFLRSKGALVDTRDSTLVLDGSISLESEKMDLRLTAFPKDFSPLSLRTPLRVQGTLASPKLVLESGELMGRIGLAALLSVINPVAALLPMMDFGGGEKGIEPSCKAVLDRVRLAQSKAKSAPAPTPVRP